MEWLHIFVCLGLVALTQSSTCHDLDHQACVLMHTADPDLCKDLALAESACPRFCNLCPMECYHCYTTMSDYHTCNTTKMCAQNEVCMQKVVTSTFDGHHAYQLSCEKKDRCDGSDLIVSFGKRGLDVRDVSISCCLQDRCNFPGAIHGSTTEPPSVLTTTTSPPSNISCKKDVFVVLDTDNVDLDASDLDHFLQALFSHLPISQDGVHVSVSYAGKYAVHPLIHLDAHTDNNTHDLVYAIHHALSRVDEISDKRDTSEVDADLMALKTVHDTRSNAGDVLKNREINTDGDNREATSSYDSSILALKAVQDSRPDAGNILITMTEGHRGHLSTGHVISTFEGQFEKVVAIGVDGSSGGGSPSAQGEVLTVGHRHMTDIVPKVASLICPNSTLIN